MNIIPNSSAARKITVEGVPAALNLTQQISRRTTHHLSKHDKDFTEIIGKDAEIITNSIFKNS